MEKSVVTTDVVDDFDISQYRLPQNFSEAVALKKIITTIPVRKPNKQALVLWYLSGLKKSLTVSLPNKPLQEMKIGKNTKRRSLKALEGAGLIKVVQKKGNSPVVTILEIEY